MPGDMAASLEALLLGDDPAAWGRLGFDVSPAGVVCVGGVQLRCTGEGGGILSWVVAPGPGPAEIDGLPTVWEPPAEPHRTAHPNGAESIDHVVVFTDSRERTSAALADAGGEVRRFRDPPAVPTAMAFVRMGDVIVEVAEAGPPTRFWGLVVVTPDVEAFERAKDAVQPGRRIATVPPEPGRETALAFITPRVRTRAVDSRADRR
jgi:hypothetical protein